MVGIGSTSSDQPMEKPHHITKLAPEYEYLLAIQTLIKPSLFVFVGYILGDPVLCTGCFYLAVRTEGQIVRAFHGVDYILH